MTANQNPADAVREALDYLMVFGPNKSARDTIEAHIVDLMASLRERQNALERVTLIAAEAEARLAALAGAVPNIGVGVDVSPDGVDVTVVLRDGCVDTVIHHEHHDFPHAPAKAHRQNRQRRKSHGDSGMIELELPWPDRALHPNSRGHWTKRAKAAKDARLTGHLLMRGGLDRNWYPIIPARKYDLHLDFYPPDRRKRDDDGCLSSFKPYRDGIADALGIDDNRFVSHPRVMDEVVKGGLVRVRIVPMEE